MPTKFYLHNAAATAGGTLPGTTARVSATTPGSGTTTSLTNKLMNDTIGTSQSSLAKTSLANTSNQAVPIGRWITTTLAAQTVLQQALIVHLAGSESNANSNFACMWCLAQWRPSTGAVIARMADTGAALSLSYDSTSETADNTTALLADTTALTLAAQDVLILEVWRNTSVQSMGTAYTNTIFFDGTTEDSTTSNAAYIQFENDVAFYVPPPPSPYRQPAGGSRQAAAHRAANIHARGF